VLDLQPALQPGSRGQAQLQAKPTIPEMVMLEFLLYLIAFLCFLAVAAGISPARVNLLGVGLAAWVLVPLIHAWPG
jgi:hypothetical protein